MRSDIMHGENVGMIESSDGTGFLLEAAQTVSVRRKGRGKNFDGDDAIEAGVAGAIDLAHTAGAERCKDFIRAEFRAAGERHW